MKEFEKWYHELPMREDAEDFTLPTYEKYNKGWKAALEWVKTLLGEHSNSGGGIIDYIYQELDE